MTITYRFTNVRVYDATNDRTYRVQNDTCTVAGGLDDNSYTEIVATCIPNPAGGGYVGPTKTTTGNRGTPQYTISGDSPEVPPRHVDFGPLRCTYVPGAWTSPTSQTCQFMRL